MSKPGVKCIFCGDLIHERGVARHQQSYHQINSLFFSGPSFNDAQTQREPGDRDFIYGSKSGQNVVKTTDGILEVQSNGRLSSRTEDHVNQFPENVTEESSIQDNTGVIDLDTSFERFRCPQSQCKYLSPTSEKVEKHIKDVHKKRKSRLSLKRKVDTSPIKQTMSLMLDPLRVPFSTQTDFSVERMNNKPTKFKEISI